MLARNGLMASLIAIVAIAIPIYAQAEVKLAQVFTPDAV